MGHKSHAGLESSDLDSGVSCVITRTVQQEKEQTPLSQVFMYVRIALQHLRGAVLQGATEIVKELFGSHHGSRAKVYQSNVETLVDDDVLIFYVPVKDVLSPQIKDSGHQLGRDRTSSLTNVCFTFHRSPVRCHILAPLHTCLKM